MSCSPQESLAKSNSWPEGKRTFTEFHDDAGCLPFQPVLPEFLEKLSVCLRVSSGQVGWSLPQEAWGTLSRKADPELWGHRSKQKKGIQQTGTRETAAALSSPGLIHLPSPRAGILVSLAFSLHGLYICLIERSFFLCFLP